MGTDEYICDLLSLLFIVIYLFEEFPPCSLPGVRQWTVDSDYQSVTSLISVSVRSQPTPHSPLTLTITSQQSSLKMTNWRENISLLLVSFDNYHLFINKCELQRPKMCLILWSVIQSFSLLIIPCGGGILVQFSDQFPLIMMSRLEFLHPSLSYSDDCRG